MPRRRGCLVVLTAVLDHRVVDGLGPPVLSAACLVLRGVDLGAYSKVYLAHMAFNVSDIARRAGVTPDAVRYYEREGLLPPAPRSASGYRQYEDDSTSQRIRFIKGAQRMGLKLTEIGELLEIQDRGACPCGHARSIVERRIEEIDDEVARLSSFRAELSEMARLDCPTTTQSELWPCEARFIERGGERVG